MADENTWKDFIKPSAELWSCDIKNIEDYLTVMANKLSEINSNSDIAKAIEGIDNCASDVGVLLSRLRMVSYQLHTYEQNQICRKVVH